MNKIPNSESMSEDRFTSDTSLIDRSGFQKIEMVVIMFVSESLDAFLRDLTRKYISNRIDYNVCCLKIKQINITYKSVMDCVADNIEVIDQNKITYRSVTKICNMILEPLLINDKGQPGRQISRLCKLLGRYNIEIGFPEDQQKVRDYISTLSIEERTALLSV